MSPQMSSVNKIFSHLLNMSPSSLESQQTGVCVGIMDPSRTNYRLDWREPLAPDMRPVYNDPPDMRTPMQYHMDGLFRCGSCAAMYHVIWQLHEHLQLHSPGGSYRYDHLTRTAFPKYDTVCKETQTLIDMEKSSELVCMATQTEDNLTNFYNTRDSMSDVEQIDTKLPDDYVRIKVEKTENGFHIEYDEAQDKGDTKGDGVCLSPGDPYSGDTDEEWEPELETKLAETVKEKIKPVTKLKKSSNNKKLKNSKLKDKYKKQAQKLKVKASKEKKRKKKTIREQKISAKKEPVKCFYCDQVFQNCLTRKRHSIAEHPNEKNHTCNQCDEAFVTDTELQKHRKQHQRERFRCPTCKKCLSSPQNLQDHMTMHTGEKTYECKDCGRYFRSRSQLTLHASRKHNPNFDQMCDNCGRTFKCRQNLKGHIRYCLDIKPFQCKVCGKRFPRNTNLNVHMRKHTGEKPFVCHTCGMKFMHSNTLTKHMLVHTGERKFSCEVCGMKFKAHNALKDHQRIHNQDKRFTCQYCGKGFIKKCNMVTHIRQHTGETPYKCHICGQAYKQNVLLRTHMQTHKNELALPSQNDSSSSQPVPESTHHELQSAHPSTQTGSLTLQPPAQHSHQQLQGFTGILRHPTPLDESMSHPVYPHSEQQHGNNGLHLHHEEPHSAQRTLQESLAEYMLARM